MIRQKSSQFMGLKMQSEFEQLSELQRELEKDLSSMDESVTRIATGVRTESGTAAGTAASVAADEDPAANLFPVRAGQSGPLMNVCRRASRQGATVVMLINVQDVSWVPW